MRIAVGLPLDDLADCAAHLESLGVDGCFVTDHPAPDDRWLAGGGHHALEPTVALAVAGGATRSLRLITNVYVLAYRNPFLAAKSLATLDVATAGRLTVGIAAGYLRPEFRALGADFDRRNDVLDESLRVVLAAWSGESVAAEGDGWSTRGVTILPRPQQRPHPPIWCGGNSRRAMRRAVEFADAWVPFPTAPGLADAARTAELTSVGDLSQRMTELAELSDAAGRAPLQVCTSPFVEIDQVADDVATEALVELADAGVSWCLVSLPSGDLAAWRDHASRLIDLSRSMRR